MSRKNEAEFLKDVLQGNTYAIAFCDNIFFISQVLDDLVDGDKAITDKDVIAAFWTSLIDIPGNPFYKAHMNTLVPMLQVFLQDWVDATNLERGTEHEQDIAFVLRDTLGGLIIHVSHIVGGYEWANTWAPVVRRHVHEDSLQEYKGGLNK